MDGVGVWKKTETEKPLDWNSAFAKKKAFNIGISSLKDSVELYARRPIIIPLYDFKNPFGVRILETGMSTGMSICIAAIVPFDGCSFSDIYLLSNADMNKAMQSNPLILGDSMIASNLKESSAIFDLSNKNLFAPTSFAKTSAEVITTVTGLAPIMYDDGNYSYSSLNLITMGNDLIVAPFELIESIPVPAGE